LDPALMPDLVKGTLNLETRHTIMLH